MLKIRTTISSFAAAASLVTLVACSGAGAESGTPEAVGSDSAALRGFPPLPSPTLAAPKGNHLAFFHDAVGVQIYSCQSTAQGFAFTFVNPEADLFDRRGNVVIKHFGGPTWQSVADGSAVVASLVAKFTDDPNSIAELLLIASAHQGTGIMDDITFVQRLETVGGLAPTTGCDAAHIGEVVRVPYTATYFFYRADSPY